MSRTSLLTTGAAAVTALANSVAQRTATGTLVAATATADTELTTLGQQTTAIGAGKRITYSNALTANYTLAPADEGKSLGNFSAASALTVTVPDDATVPFPAGGFVDLVRHGAQNITVSPAAGVTVVWRGQSVAAQAFTMTARFAAVRLHKISATVWYAYDLTGTTEDTGWVQVTTLATGFSPGGDNVHYRVKDGVCHFRMHVICDTGTRTGLVYTFPAAARPTQLVWFIGTSSASPVAELKLLADGTLTMGTRVGGNTLGAFVVSGSFPVG